MLAGQGIGTDVPYQGGPVYYHILWSRGPAGGKVPIHDRAVFRPGQLNEISCFFVSVGPGGHGMERRTSPIWKQRSI